MPLFEFRCTTCDHEFETLVRSSEQPECPECRSQVLEKLMSPSAAHVAGGRLLPIAAGCPPGDAPPCSPHCCRLPGEGGA